MSERFKDTIFYSFVGFCALIMALIIGINLKSNRDAQAILAQSVESQLLSISLAARDIINPVEIASLNTVDDIVTVAGRDTYRTTLSRLRTLARSVSADYIYVLKPIDGTYRFIYDTDPADDDWAEEYELSEVHQLAFQGEEAASVMSVNDEFGSFNTSAVPIWRNGKVIAIVSTDTSDAMIRHSIDVANTNAALLISAAGITLVVMCVLMWLLLRKIRQMQDHLSYMAHYDTLTSLPNRQYLLGHLDQLTKAPDRNKHAFALFFIDLDNFKKVNDTAGHDAGDALLKNVGAYLQSAHESSKVFRPSAGGLNVAARIGGDEFIIVVPGIESLEQAGQYANELLEGFRAEAIDKHIDTYDVGLSIGVALYPYHSENYHVIIKYADIAMYHAKNAGKNCSRLYEETMPDKGVK